MRLVDFVVRPSGLRPVQVFDRADIAADGVVREPTRSREPVADRPLDYPTAADRSSNTIATATVSVVGRAPTDLVPATCYWRGASGRIYRHSTHTTIFCPAPARGVYVLARRNQRGVIVPLFVGAAASTAASLNLARIRRRAVTLGASEVHLCPVKPASGALAVRRVVRDIRAALRDGGASG